MTIYKVVSYTACPLIVLNVRLIIYTLLSCNFLVLTKVVAYNRKFSCIYIIIKVSSSRGSVLF